MSYYRNNYESIDIINDNMRTRAFTESIQRYLWDFFNGIRIESLSRFSIKMEIDDFLISGESVNLEPKGHKIVLKSNFSDQEEMTYALTHLNEYERIRIILDYSGHFFMFYPYGIERISSLLNKWVQNKVVYKCSETCDSSTLLYVFEKREGDLINGIIAPGEIESICHIKKWNLDLFALWLEFDKSMSKLDFEKLQKLTDELLEKYCLYPDYGSIKEKKNGRIRFSDLHIEKTPYRIGGEDYITKDIFSVSEIEDVYNILHKIFKLTKKSIDVIQPEIIFKSADKDSLFLTIMITADMNNKLKLNAYNIDSNDVVEYRSQSDEMLKKLEEVEQIYLPIEGISFGENNDVL